MTGLDPGSHPRRIIVLIAAATLCLVAVVSPIRAAAATNELAFSPSSSTVGVGKSVNVDITVANVSNLGGYNLYLQFDASAVHLSSLTDSGFVTNNPNNVVVCNSATIDNSAGTATDSCATQAIFGSPGPGVSTTSAVALMHASFTGVAPGTSQLTLNGTTLLDPDGIPLSPAPTLGAGSITVTLSVGGVARAIDSRTLPESSPAASVGTVTRRFAFGAAALVAVIPALIATAWRRKRR